MAKVLRERVVNNPPGHCIDTKVKLTSRAITMLQILRDENSEIVTDWETGETYHGNHNVRCDILPQLIRAMAVGCVHRDGSIEHFCITYVGREILDRHESGKKGRGEETAGFRPRSCGQ